MAGVTLQQAQANLDAAQAALLKAMQIQDYTMSSTTGSRRVQRASVADLQNVVQYWEQRVVALSRNGGLRVSYVIPR